MHDEMIIKVYAKRECLFLSTTSETRVVVGFLNIHILLCFRFDTIFLRS
jgi:hypothetical protein